MVTGLSDREISADIIESCRRGDRDAFRALYEAYKDKVYSIALYFFHGDEAAASDMTQQVFLKLIRGIAQFRGEAGFSTWLYRLVVNACMDGARRAKPREMAATAAVVDVLAGPDSQERDFAREQTARSVRAALSALPVKFRLPILLRYFEDLSYGEMAAAMNCSMGTVASRLNRGHKMLARKLESLR
ncbi:MAG TPA: sigma-70 family RNA polymerase sigma factor [Bryobacteraceae bacterium]|jgi:RNA polymerase sigma-70 factor (ECF subfamily)